LGFFRVLWRRIVEICTAAGTPTLTNPGWSWRSTVMKTGGSVSPCLFVQAGATAVAAARRSGIQRFLFIGSPFFTA
jgi:hypothetical protein